MISIKELKKRYLEHLRRGSRQVNREVLPWSGKLFTSVLPPCASAMDLAMLSPSPTPLPALLRASEPRMLGQTIKDLFLAVSRQADRLSVAVRMAQDGRLSLPW